VSSGNTRRRAPRLAAALVALLAGLPAVVATAPAAAAGKPEGISAGQADQILEELRAIRALLEKQAAARPPAAAPSGEPTTVTVPWVERPALGGADAEVVVLEFTDYACPFCQRFHETTWPALKRDFVDTGKVRWVVRDLPLPIHPDARVAAQATHCAGEQGRFWELRTVLYANRAALGRAALEAYAGQLKLDVPRFRACLDGGGALAGIDADAAAADAARITGTPSFVVGRRKGGVVEGQLVVGAQSAAVFDGAIRMQLAQDDDAR